MCGLTVAGCYLLLPAATQKYSAISTYETEHNSQTGCSMSLCGITDRIHADTGDVQPTLPWSRQSHTTAV
jgi:hypothetical protein